MNIYLVPTEKTRDILLAADDCGGRPPSVHKSDRMEPDWCPCDDREFAVAEALVLMRNNVLYPLGCMRAFFVLMGEGGDTGSFFPQILESHQSEFGRAMTLGRTGEELGLWSVVVEDPLGTE